jgi:hypothetical protein
MSGLGVQNNWSNVRRKDKRRVVGPIEDEIEMMFRMLGRNSFQRFICEPPDSFKFIFDQQASIDSNVHQVPKI